MKQSANIAIAAIVAAVFAAGGGYLAGKRKVDGGVTASAPANGHTEAVVKKERKLLYYRNPMGLPDTSPVPKKDPMGMDYIPVYEGEEDADSSSGNQIKISTEKVQKLGVRTEKAAQRTIDKVVRAAGRIEPDERRVFVISPKFEGYVERLHVNATGQLVGKGQPLFEVYSPELVSAQREYVIAAQGLRSLKGADSDAQSGMRQLADSSLLRLRNWDISEEQIKALTQSGDAKRTMTFRSPVSGIVTEKKAVQGMRFMPGEMLYQISDLSTVWVFADVFEQDISLVKPGTKAKVRINAYADKEFDGNVTYVYPTLNAATRTAQVRVELANPGQLLKPGMFANVELAAAPRSTAVTVPVSAVIDSGTRRIVLVQRKEGRFEPRDVKLGARSDNYVEVLEGVQDGEDVVVAANFLIDAESNLKAAVGSFGGQAAQETGAMKPAGAGHKAEGTIDEIDVKSGTVSVNHGPVASLKWPAMTMEFKVANNALLKNMKPGDPVTFEFVERQPGEWVITGFQSAAATIRKPPAPAADPHAGHR
ncbi:efflux RND transporter periplasmic adaptor subunit [Noviherbaspirillum sp. ST9]|uniref:efflux RND transporter periplasmic adaptor subunit n=1 Tax=Noviherbaspirillum sp. ST9 TaxID=3401606 RepID=UPI003B587CA0